MSNHGGVTPSVWRRAWRPVLCVAGTGLTAPHVAAQASAPPVPPAAVTVTAGARYRAGWLHRLLLGAHYRDLWTTSVRVPVLDLGRFSGGLAPQRRGGGRETTSLRLQGADGRAYAFRSVDKDPTAALSPDLRQTFVKGIVQDQISSSHPAGALVVAPLLDAAGVLNAAPQLFVMPDDPRLGAFRPAFAGMLGQLEERPRHDPEDEPDFGGATRVVTTAKLWEYLDRGPENRVDARAFLAARLLDVYVGDWDRHAAQWRWAPFDEGDTRLWRPIPRDRDQAFSKLDGLLPWLAHYYFLDLVGFAPDYPAVIKLTWDGRVLDRRRRGRASHAGRVLRAQWGGARSGTEASPRPAAGGRAALLRAPRPRRRRTRHAAAGTGPSRAGRGRGRRGPDGAARRGIKRPGRPLLSPHVPTGRDRGGAALSGWRRRSPRGAGTRRRPDRRPGDLGRRRRRARGLLGGGRPRV